MQKLISTLGTGPKFPLITRVIAVLDREQPQLVVETKAAIARVIHNFEQIGEPLDGVTFISREYQLWARERALIEQGFTKIPDRSAYRKQTLTGVVTTSAPYEFTERGPAIDEPMQAIDPLVWENYYVSDFITRTNEFPR